MLKSLSLLKTGVIISITFPIHETTGQHRNHSVVIQQCRCTLRVIKLVWYLCLFVSAHAHLCHLQPLSCFDEWSCGLGDLKTQNVHLWHLVILLQYFSGVIKVSISLSGMRVQFQRESHYCRKVNITLQVDRRALTSSNLSRPHLCLSPPSASHLHWATLGSRSHGYCCSLWPDRDLCCPQSWNSWTSADKDGDTGLLDSYLGFMESCSFTYNKIPTCHVVISSVFWRGGLRAAVWTPLVLQDRHRDTDCGKRAFVWGMITCIQAHGSNYLCIRADTLEEAEAHLTVPHWCKWVLSEKKEAGWRVKPGRKSNCVNSQCWGSTSEFRVLTSCHFNRRPLTDFLVRSVLFLCFL